MSVAVFVSSIRREVGGVLVEANNGGTDSSSPFVRWRLPIGAELGSVFIGKRYMLSVEEAPE